MARRSSVPCVTETDSHWCHICYICRTNSNCLHLKKKLQHLAELVSNADGNDDSLPVCPCTTLIQTGISQNLYYGLPLNVVHRA